jgi:hypothetical protein
MRTIATVASQSKNWLVADVATGKLDVRPAARHLPAEPLAPESGPDPQESTEPEKTVAEE